jgi:hypothetical protein
MFSRCDVKHRENITFTLTQNFLEGLRRTAQTFIQKTWHHELTLMNYVLVVCPNLAYAFPALVSNTSRLSNSTEGRWRVETLCS